MKSLWCSIFLLLCIYHEAFCSKSHNKYSKEANYVEAEIHEPKDTKYLKEMKTPLRMAKLNLVWQKAIKVRKDDYDFNYFL